MLITTSNSTSIPAAPGGSTQDEAGLSMSKMDHLIAVSNLNFLYAGSAKSIVGPATTVKTPSTKPARRYFGLAANAAK